MAKRGDIGICPICKTPFTVKNYKHRYCSRKCSIHGTNTTGKMYISKTSKPTETKYNTNLDVYLLAKEQVESLLGMSHCSYGTYAKLLEDGKIIVTVTDIWESGTPKEVEVKQKDVKEKQISLCM